MIWRRVKSIFCCVVSHDCHVPCSAVVKLINTKFYILKLKLLVFKRLEKVFKVIKVARWKKRLCVLTMQQIWIFFSCHSVFTFLRTGLLSFWVTESLLRQCFAVRNSVIFLTKTKTKAWISVLWWENSNFAVWWEFIHK